MHANTLDSLSSRARILLVTDDADASHVFRDVLAEHGVDTFVASSSNSLTSAPEMDSFHEILVDWNGEPSTALEICRKLRNLSSLPLLFCTYEKDERFQLEAYRLGVDECIKKPIGLSLLLAKVKSWLHKVLRNNSRNQEVVTSHFLLDLVSKTLETSEASVKLSALECRLMEVFMANRGRPLETDFVIHRVWSKYSNPNPRILKNLVYRLRHKIERVSDGGPYIENVAGTGYMFHDEY